MDGCTSACHASTGPEKGCECACDGKSHGQGAQEIPAAGADGLVLSATPAGASREPQARPVDDEWLSDLGEDQLYLLHGGHVPGAQMTAVKVWETERDGHRVGEHSNPVVYTRTDSVNGVPLEHPEVGFVDNLGRVGAAERLPDGERVTIDRDRLERRMDEATKPAPVSPGGPPARPLPRGRRRTASEVAATITPEAIRRHHENLERRLREDPSLREQLDTPVRDLPADRATLRYRRRMARLLDPAPARREGPLARARRALASLYLRRG